METYSKEFLFLRCSVLYFTYNKSLLAHSLKAATKSAFLTSVTSVMFQSCNSHFRHWQLYIVNGWTNYCYLDLSIQIPFIVYSLFHCTHNEINWGFIFWCLFKASWYYIPAFVHNLQYCKI